MEYGPYGERLRSLDSALRSPFGFSTKYTDNETGLCYYGLRFSNVETGRFLSRDPSEEQGGANLYAVAGNNAVDRIDALGLSWNTPSSVITPWELGVEWLTADGPRHRDFIDGYHFAELLRTHEHIREKLREASQQAAKQCAVGSDRDFQISWRTGKYALSGVRGVGKYLRDYSTIMTGGMTGNLAVTFLGSYSMRIIVTKIDCCKKAAHAFIEVNNSSTAASALRPPLLGYTAWWQENVAPLVNNLFRNGGGSPTSQHVELNEDIKF